MFDSLVESGSHKDDLARKGSFFLGTFAIYAVILLALGVLSVYLYNESLPSDNLELMTMVAPVPVQNQPEQQPEKQQESKPAEATPDRQVATRTEFVASNLDPTKVPEKVSAVASRVPPVPPGGAALGRAHHDPHRGPPPPPPPARRGRRRPPRAAPRRRPRRPPAPPGPWGWGGAPPRGPRPPHGGLGG